MGENNSFRLNKFLENNYHLFAIIGVFGALSIYLSRLLNDTSNGIFLPNGLADLVMKVGILSSLSLFSLVSLSINAEFLKSIYSSAPTDEHIYDLVLYVFDYKRTIEIMFFVSFNILIISIFVVTFSFPDAVRIFGSLVLFVLGFGICLVYQDLGDIFVFDKLYIPYNLKVVKAFIVITLALLWNVTPYIVIYLIGVPVLDFNLKNMVSNEGIMILAFSAGWTVATIGIASYIIFFSVIALNNESEISFGI